MIPYLLFVLGVLLVASPGIGCWTMVFPRDSTAQRMTWGSVLGIATAVYVAEICSFVHLSWFYAAWTALMMVIVGSFYLWPRLGGESLRGQSEVVNEAGFLQRLTTGPHLALVLLLLLIGVLQIVAVRGYSVPRGWDPSFHLLLAKKIALSDGIIRDWQPFESAALNYPIGSHYLIVLFSWFSGLPLPLVFQLLMVTFGLLSILAIFTLAGEYFASATVGLYASIAYSLWAFWGSTDYLAWGGLPNQLGMLMGLGILSLVIRNGEQKKRIILIALLFAAICLTHHHVMVTMGIILIVQMLIFLAIRDPDRRYLTIFYALGLSAGAAAFFLIPYAMKAVSVSDTRVFHFHDPLDLMRMGLVLVPFALVGAALDYSRKGASSHVFHSASATLLLLYVLFGPGYYYYQLATTGEGFVAFTPSRFLSDLTYFFSIFAGYALFRAEKYFGFSGRVTIALALLLALTNLPQWDDLLVNDGGRGRFAAYDWIANHTPANSIVFTTEPWACYATWRRTLLTPMPISEPRVPPRISEHAKMQMLYGRHPAELRGIELLEVLGPGERQGGKVLWSNADGWTVAEPPERFDIRELP
jgi:hypothetical protein